MANPYISASSQISFGAETTPGTRASSLTKILGITNQDITFPDKQLEVLKYYTFGGGRRPRRLMPAARTREGSLGIVPTSGELFAYALGKDSFSSPTHTLTINGPGTNPARAILPSFSWAATMFDDAQTRTFQRVFVGSVIDKLDFEVRKEEELDMNLSIKSLDVEDETLSSPTVPSLTQPATTGVASRPYMWYDSTVTVYGNTQARVEGFFGGINNNLKTKRYLVSGTGQNPAEYLTSNVDWTLGMDFVPAGFLSSHTGSGGIESVYHLLENESVGDVSITLIRGTGPENSLKFDFTDCIFKEAPHSWSREGNEMVVPVKIEPREFTVTVKDTNSQYF